MSSFGNQAYSPIGLLNENEWRGLTAAVSSFNATQLTWASGYLAGLAQAGSQGPVVPAPQPTAEQKLTVLYGSQTGNAKGVAQQYAAQAKEAGFQAVVHNMADYKPKNLKNESHLVIVVSTHGEGEAPDDAAQLHELLGSKKAPKLPNLNYAVLGLGDSSYEFFCQTAKDFDERLAATGAKAFAERVDCDVDYDDDVASWTERLNAKLKDDLKTSSVVPMPGINIQSGAAANAANSAQVEYTKKSPFEAELIDSIKITGRDSVKDIRHIEISLEDSGIAYQPGDALGVWFENDPSVVSVVLDKLQLDGSQEVNIKDETYTLKQALIEKLEITQSYPGFVQKYAAATGNEELNTLFADKAKLREYLEQRQIVDIVNDYPTEISADAFVACFRPLTPRLYSIASSQSEVEEEVHLTVGMVEYEQFGINHQGGASGYLGDRVGEGQKVKVFVEHNNNFRLPQDPNTPVIMIGPGTGIAPFRAFLQEREAQEAEGKNWLFFGNPHFTQDFLYQVELQKYLKDGVLDQISLAFSRDQEEKVYVQHRILEQGEEVFNWLEQGAHLYVCGDANQMAKDVDAALLEVVKQHGGKSDDEAKQYIKDLRRAKRFQKDVY